MHVGLNTWRKNTKQGENDMEKRIKLRRLSDILKYMAQCDHFPRNVKYLTFSERFVRKCKSAADMETYYEYDIHNFRPEDVKNRRDIRDIIPTTAAQEIVEQYNKFARSMIARKAEERAATLPDYARDLMTERYIYAMTYNENNPWCTGAEENITPDPDRRIFNLVRRDADVAAHKRYAYIVENLVQANIARTKREEFDNLVQRKLEEQRSVARDDLVASIYISELLRK